MWWRPLLTSSNNRDKNFTRAKMQRRMAQIEESVERYLTAMDTADRAEPEVAQLKKGQLQDKIAALKEQMHQLKALEAQRLASPDQQLSLTDPDVRSMKSRDGGIVGYNVQTAVDARHHLIVAHEVITEGVDRNQLSRIAEQAHGPPETAPPPSLIFWVGSDTLIRLSPIFRGLSQCPS